MSTRTNTTTYKFGARTATIHDTIFEGRDPYTGQVVFQRTVNRNVSLDGFTAEEEIAFFWMLKRNDIAGIQRRFGS